MPTRRAALRSTQEHRDGKLRKGRQHITASADDIWHEQPARAAVVAASVFVINWPSNAPRAIAPISQANPLGGS